MTPTDAARLREIAERAKRCSETPPVQFCDPPPQRDGMFSLGTGTMIKSTSTFHDHDDILEKDIPYLLALVRSQSEEIEKMRAVVEAARNAISNTDGRIVPPEEVFKTVKPRGWYVRLYDALSALDGEKK